MTLKNFFFFSLFFVVWCRTFCTFFVLCAVCFWIDFIFCFIFVFIFFGKHWKPAGDDRRATAVEVLQSIGQSNISAEGILQALQTPPVLNDGTLYTALMSAKYPDTWYVFVDDYN